MDSHDARGKGQNWGKCGVASGVIRPSHASMTKHSKDWRKFAKWLRQIGRESGASPELVIETLRAIALDTDQPWKVRLIALVMLRESLSVAARRWGLASPNEHMIKGWVRGCIRKEQVSPIIDPETGQPMRRKGLGDALSTPGNYTYRDDLPPEVKARARKKPPPPHTPRSGSR